MTQPEDPVPYTYRDGAANYVGGLALAVFMLTTLTGGMLLWNESLQSANLLRGAFLVGTFTGAVLVGLMYAYPVRVYEVLEGEYEPDEGEEVCES